MSSDSSKNNSLVVRSNSSKKKIVFNDKEKYDNAVHNQKEIIADTINEINYIEEELRKLKLIEEELEKEAKASKKTTKRAQIPTSQKHTIVPVYEFDNIYNYDERRKSWHKKAGHNNSQVVCDYCKDDDNWETILLDNDKHVCYYCWIKKPDNLKNKKTSIVVKKKPQQVDVIDYEEIYPVELDTLRTAFQVLPRPVQKEYEKRIYKMIDCLIDKKFIKKRH